MKEKVRAGIFAFLAAVFYAVNIPLSKMLLDGIEPVFMSAFLYLGAGIGMGILYMAAGTGKRTPENKLTKAERPYAVGMIVLDIAAPVCLMLGLSVSDAANASLLSNFEIVATSVVALVVFKELISKRLWTAVLLITLASLLLSFEDVSSLRFSYGSLFVIAACVCWGFENNCTRMMSSKDTFEIVMLKGVFSGAGSLVIAMIIGEEWPEVIDIVIVMLLGFVSYGLSIFLYVRAQKEIGAAKTSAYYAAAPFFGVLLSCFLFREKLGWGFFAALPVMLAGAALVVYDTLVVEHTHMHTHRYVHTENGKTGAYMIKHSHLHIHFFSADSHVHRH